MKLLTLNQVKMLKSADEGYLSAILNLQPAMRYNGVNTCPWAGKCKGTCLENTGRNRFDGARIARERKTKLLIDHPAAFMQLLREDLQALVRKAKRENVRPSTRLNGLSDINWLDPQYQIEGSTIFDLFPSIQFIDYTKDPNRLFDTVPANYHLTYSYNEKTTLEQLVPWLDSRFNVAKLYVGEDLPTTDTFNGLGYHIPVIDGSGHDLRHLDPRGCIVGLKYRLPFVMADGKAYRPTKSNGFLHVLAA